jgi:hypothetical protein
VALSALIAALHESDGGDESLIALLPVAGRTLLEHQARAAARAGATRILMLVERVPAALLAAVDRLRAAGLSVDIARSVADAADRLHPQEEVLVFADGAVVDPMMVEVVARARTPALLTIADDPDTQMFERIDGGTRWGGLALLDGASLRRTAAMLGNWDLQSTLLRRAVQQDAERVVAAAVTPSAAPPMLILVTSRGDAERASERLQSNGRGGDRDWASKTLYALPIKLLTAALLPTFFDAPLIRFIALLCSVGGATSFAVGWLWPGLILLLIAGPLASVSRRIVRIRLQTGLRYERLALAGWFVDQLAIVLFAGWLAGHGGGWGCSVLAIVIIAATFAAEVENRLYGRLTGIAIEDGAPADRLVATFGASRDGLFLLLVPFAIFNLWVVGLAAMALYAGASFFIRQARFALALDRWRGA